MMKLLKTKFATALMLAGLMFGMFSFTTTPVVAQDTDSTDIVMEEEYQAALARLLGRAFIKGVAWGVGYLVGERIIGNLEATSEYPSDSLDP